jgi:nitroreductase
MSEMSLSSDVLELLHTRVSYPRLESPAPEGALLKRILMTAMRAPDHKVLRPARYLLVEGERREELGEIFAHAAQRSDPSASDAKLEKCRAMPLRAPLVLVAISKNIEHPKVPVFEQEQSVASGLAHILIALQACGFGGIWRTGEMAVDAYVKQQLGLQEHESLVGFLYIGTPVGDAKRIPTLQFEDYFCSW